MLIEKIESKLDNINVPRQIICPTSAKLFANAVRQTAELFNPIHQRLEQKHNHQ